MLKAQALLIFSECLLITKRSGRSSLTWDKAILESRVLFDVATTFQSNGLLSGILLPEETFRTLLIIRPDPYLSNVRRLSTTGLGGLAVAVVILLPQYIA